MSRVGDAGSIVAAEGLVDSVRDTAGSFASALPRLGVAVVMVAAGYGLSVLVRWGLRSVLRRRRTPSFARVMSKVAGWVVLALAVGGGVIAVFPSVKPVDLLAGLGFFSVAVGFAFQDILENTLAGVLLLFRQPFESGDQIEVQEQSGTVEAITIRETRIKTFEDELVLIPNRDVYKSVIRVQTHFELRRLAFAVGIAYENDARQATGIMVDAMASTEGVAADPAPEALVDELGVSTVDIEARFWTGSRQHDARRVRDEVIKTVKAALEAAGIEMPADIVVLQATPSFKAALRGEGEVTPGGAVRDAAPVPETTAAGRGSS